MEDRHPLSLLSVKKFDKICMLIFPTHPCLLLKTCCFSTVCLSTSIYVLRQPVLTFHLWQLGQDTLNGYLTLTLVKYWCTGLPFSSYIGHSLQLLHPTSDDVPKGVEVEVEWLLTYRTFPQESEVWVLSVTKSDTLKRQTNNLFQNVTKKIWWLNFSEVKVSMIASANLLFTCFPLH